MYIGMPVILAEDVSLGWYIRSLTTSRMIMKVPLKENLKEKIPELIKAFVARFVDENPDEESFSRDRLKQLQNRYSISQDEQIDHEDGQMSEMIEFNDQSEDAVVRWCGNEDRFLDQNIRQHDQMKGVENAFEIDPMSKLPVD